MKLLPPLLFLASLVTIFPVGILDAAPAVSARNFRPLAPKSVRIEVSGRPERGGTNQALTRKGWKEFDASRWEKAMDAFLSALEADSGDASAAEGLTMAVYRSGDRISAAQLGEEFSGAMPWIRDAVVETLIVDVRREIGEGKIREVKELAANLPYAEGAYDEVRLLAESKGEPGDVRIEESGRVTSASGGKGALIDVSFPGEVTATEEKPPVELTSLASSSALRAEPVEGR
ncbi:MAG: hypothetical protein KDN18_18520 [Verrucomicrobiae bacterium]|nr:hypothetical protein [Verrucomicrobiae bacterium]